MKGDHTMNDKTCATCINNDDGLCDRLGKLVEPDDAKCRGTLWEGKHDNDREH